MITRRLAARASATRIDRSSVAPPSVRARKYRHAGTDKDGDGVPDDHDDDSVPDDDRFVAYEVNGEGQRSRQSTLTVEEILRRAGASAGIDTADLGNYYLERLRDGRRFDRLEDEVVIADGDQFLAVYANRTPVA